MSRSSLDHSEADRLRQRVNQLTKRLSEVEGGTKRSVVAAGGGDGTGVEVIELDAGNGDVTETLPAASAGATALALRVDSSPGNTATLDTPGAEEIRFAEGKNVSSTTLNVEQSLLLSSDGSHWYVEEGQGLRAKAETVTSVATDENSPPATQIASYDDSGGNGPFDAEITRRVEVTDRDNKKYRISYYNGDPGGNGTEILQVTDQGTIRARQDVVAFGLSGGSSSSSSSNLAAPGDALTLYPGPDPDEIEFTQDIQDSSGNPVLSGAGTIQFKGSAVSSVSNPYGSRVEVEISGGSNVGSLIDLSDVGSAGAGDGEVLIGNSTDYDSILLSTAASNHLDLADLNNAQYSSLTGTPSIPVAGVGLDNNSGDFDIDVSDFDGDGLTSNSNDLDVDSTVARTNAPETFNDDVYVSGGDVGIGTTSPNAALDVNGSLIARDTLTFGGGSLSSGNTLITFDAHRDYEIKREANTSGSAGTANLVFNSLVAGNAWEFAYQNTTLLEIGGAKGINFYNENVGIQTTAPSTALGVDGGITASGEIEAFGTASDKRLKTGLDPLESALDKVGRLTGYGFDWKGEDAVHPRKRGESDVGVVAQEVEDVLPEAVNTFQGGHSEGFKGVSYDKLVALLVEAIKDLRNQVNQLQ